MTLNYKKKYIIFPSTVNFYLKNRKIIISGPYGKLCYFLPSFFSLKQIKPNCFDLIQHKSSKKIFQLRPLFFSLLNNMILGVLNPFKKVLILKGVGYRCKKEDNNLILYLSFTNPIKVEIPLGIKVSITNFTKIEIEGLDKEKVSSFGALLKSKKIPNLYKGKGIFYEDEQIKLKKSKN